MAEQKTSVDWHAALYIWWGEIWRILLIYVFIAIVIKGVEMLTPVVYDTFSHLVIEYEGTTLLLILFFHFYIHIRAIKESFVDRYTTFSLFAENKATKRSEFGINRKLKSHHLIVVWWAQTWRMLLIPAAIVAGNLAAIKLNHPNAANYTHLLNNSLTKLNLYAAFVLSLWATKESLGDRYRTFKFIAKEKDFYNR